MTKSEAIHRAALRKHRHKGNYIETHEALLDEAEYLQCTPDVRTEPSLQAKAWLLVAFALTPWIAGLLIVWTLP